MFLHIHAAVKNAHNQHITRRGHLIENNMTALRESPIARQHVITRCTQTWLFGKQMENIIHAFQILIPLRPSPAFLGKAGDVFEV